MLLSPNLSVEFSFAPQDTSTSLNSPANALASTSSSAALSLFRLPALAVGTLPSASWTAEVRRPTLVEQQEMLAAYDEGNEEEMVKREKTETWTVEVKWKLELGGGGGEQQQQDRKNGTSSLEQHGGFSGHKTDDGDDTRRKSQSLYSKKGSTRIIELVFRTKEIQSSSLDTDAQLVPSQSTSRSSDPQPPSHGSSSGSRTLVSTSPTGSRSEKVSLVDTPLEMYQLVSLRYILPPTSLVASVAASLPQWLHTFLSLAIAVFLPFINLLLVFLKLDASHVLSGRSLHRRKALHKRSGGEAKDVKGKGKAREIEPFEQEEEEAGGDERQSRARRRRSSSQTLVGTSSAVEAITTTKEEDEALARLAALTSSESDHDPFSPAAVHSRKSRGEHPKHVRRSRRWSASTSGTSSYSDFSESEHPHPHHQHQHSSSSGSTVLTFAQDLSSTLSSASATAMSGATGVVEDAKDVAWTIRRGVLLGTEIFAAVVDVGWSLVFFSSDAAGEEIEAGMGRGRVVPRKRKTGGDVEGLEEKRAKHEEGEDVSDSVAEEGEGAEEEKGGKGEGKRDDDSRSPALQGPSSPPKSAMATNG